MISWNKFEVSNKNEKSVLYRMLKVVKKLFVALSIQLKSL